MAIPIISIVGKSNSGKTTLIEKLIPELALRGLRVGAIKHCVHGFEIDHPGKDSRRFKQAGAEIAVVASPEQIAIVKSTEREMTLDEIAGNIDVDIILAEGYKGEAKPKIEVMASSGMEIISPIDDILLLVADPKDIEKLVQNFPELNEKGIEIVSRDDIDKITNTILETTGTEAKKRNIQLIVDNKPIDLNPMMKVMISNTVFGLISALKGVRDPNSVELRIRRKN